jgi:hypothetical protein
MKHIIPGISNAEYVALILERDHKTLSEKMGGEVGVGMGGEKAPLPPCGLTDKHGEIFRASDKSYYYTFMLELYGREYRGVMEASFTGRGMGKPWLETLELPSIRDLKRWEMNADIVKLKCFYKSTSGAQREIDLTDSQDEGELYDEILEIILGDGEFHWTMQDFAGTEIENLKYENWLEIADYVDKRKTPDFLNFSYDFNNYSMSNGYEATSSDIYRKSYSGTLQVTFDDSVNLLDCVIFKEFSYLKKMKGDGDPNYVYVDGRSREAYDLFNSMINNNKSLKDSIIGYESSADDRGDYE